MNTINMNTLHMNTIKQVLKLKKLFLLASLFFAAGAYAQNSNMFVVYSLKGNVSIVDNKPET